MRKVLIVSPHFAPINAPDMQRVRLALPHLRAFGWEPVVLAVAPELVEGGVRDELLEKTYPADVRIVRTGGMSAKWTRRFRIGSLWLRCGRALRAAGDRLLRDEPFDLVFFSTTQFDAFTLGPRWKRRFGVPYLLDYQDPWFTDYYSRTGKRPPGGRLKFAFAQWRARRREPLVLCEAARIIAVSPAYGAQLACAYPGFDAARVHVLPFGASEHDLELARTHAPRVPLVPCGDGCFHHVYTGRGGADMARSLTALFRAFRHYKDSHPEKAERMRFHFIGTDYAPPPLGRESVMPIARAEGVETHVHEHCRRVSYFDALHYLVNADALLAVGSDDPSYSASKIFPYVLARRPALLVFHHKSPVLAFAERIHCGVRVGLQDAGSIDEAASDILHRWFVTGGLHSAPISASDSCSEFGALAMTRTLADHFDVASSS